MENQTETQPPALSLRLRDGSTLELHTDATGAETLRYGGSEALNYPLADLAEASLVADTTVPPLPTGLPWPAVRVQLRNGTATVFSPADPPEATKLLEAIYQRRPDLRVMAPPPPPNYGYAGYAPGYPGYAPGYPPPHPSGIPSSDRNLAGICHLSVFFAPVIFPLIVWLVVRNSQPYASHQAKQAFFWHLIFWGISIALFAVAYGVFFAGMMSSAVTAGTGGPHAPFGAAFLGVIIAYLVIFALSIVDIVFSIIGTVQAFQGRPFHYPLLGKL